VSNLLRAELLKLRTTRTFVALAASALGVSLLVVVLASAIGEGITQQDARDIVSVDLTRLFILVLGAIGMTGEWRHRTITSAILAAPDRIRFLVSKLVAYAAAGAVLSLGVTLVVAVVSTLILSSRGEETVAVGDLLDVLWRNLIVAALFGAIGVAVGSLARVQVLAIVGLLVCHLVVEPTLGALAPKVERFGPLVGAPSGLFADTLGAGDADALSPVLGVLVELGWIAALAGLGALQLRRRDLI
jgi:ABC-2 type transport system permease protein